MHERLTLDGPWELVFGDGEGVDKAVIGLGCGLGCGVGVEVIVTGEAAGVLSMIPVLSVQSVQSIRLLGILGKPLLKILTAKTTITIHKAIEIKILIKSPLRLSDSSLTRSSLRRKNIKRGLLNFKLKMFTSFFFPFKITK